MVLAIIKVKSSVPQPAQIAIDMGPIYQAGWNDFRCQVSE